MNSGMSQVKPDLLLFFALTFSLFNFNNNIFNPSYDPNLKFKYSTYPYTYLT